MAASSPAEDSTKPETYYQSFLAEREEILRHKWLLNEPLNYEIPFETALLDWVEHRRSAWLKEQKD